MMTIELLSSTKARLPRCDVNRAPTASQREIVGNFGGWSAASLSFKWPSRRRFPPIHEQYVW